MSKNKERNIFLVGFMGSGKTSLGKKLAGALSLNFIDLDQYIEFETQQAINTIFKQQGEDYFRSLETKSLVKLLKNSEQIQHVIALGGGTVCFNQNLELVKKHGLVVYLELPLKVIIGRLKKDKENRPLVKDLKEEDLIKTVSELFAQREKYYQAADYTLDAQTSKSKLKKQLVEIIENQK